MVEQGLWTAPVIAAAGVAWVACAQALLARRWDGLPLLGWLTAVGWLWAPPQGPRSVGIWAVVGLCVVVTLVRRPASKLRGDRLAAAGVMSGALGLAVVLGLPSAAVLAVGGVVGVGLAASTLDDRSVQGSTRWVGTISVQARGAEGSSPSDSSRDARTG